MTCDPQPEDAVTGNGGLVRVRAQGIIKADGVQPGAIEIFVRDAQGAPVPNAGVSIGPTGGDEAGLTITQPGLTDAVGRAVGFARSSAPGTKSLLVSVTTPDGTTTPVGPVRVFFIPDVTPIVADPGGTLAGTVSTESAEKAEARAWDAKVLAAEFFFRPPEEADFRPADFAIGKGLSPVFEIRFTDALYFHQLCAFPTRCGPGTTLLDPSLDTLRVGLVVDDGSDETSFDRSLDPKTRFLIPREHKDLFDFSGNTLHYFPSGKPGMASTATPLRLGTNRLQLFAEGLDDRQRELTVGAGYGHTLRATPIAIAEMVLVDSDVPPAEASLRNSCFLTLIDKYDETVDRINPLDADLLSQSIQQENSGGRPLGIVSHLNPYRLQIRLAGSLSDVLPDTLDARIINNADQSFTAMVLRETGVNAHVFTNAERTFNVTVVGGGDTLDPTRVDLLQLDVSGRAHGIPYSGRKQLYETSENSRLFKEESIRGTIISGRPFLPEVTDAVTLSLTTIENRTINAVLQETGDNTLTFANAEQGITFKVYAVFSSFSDEDGFHEDKVDELIGWLSQPAFGLSEEPIVAIETDINSLAFESEITPNTSVVNGGYGPRYIPKLSQ